MCCDGDHVSRTHLGATRTDQEEGIYEVGGAGVWGLTEVETGVYSPCLWEGARCRPGVLAASGVTWRWHPLSERLPG